MKNNSASIKKAVILLDSGTIYWNSQGSTDILHYNLPPGAIVHREVFDKDEIYKTFKKFLVDNKIPPLHCVILLSPSITYSQTFSIESLDQKIEENNDQKNKAQNQGKSNKINNSKIIQTKIDKFVNLIPHENIGSVSLQQDSKTTVYAVNQEYYEVIRDVLISSDFTVNAIAPVAALGTRFSESNSLDQNLINTVYSSIENISKHSFTSAESKPLFTNDNIEENDAVSQHEKPKRNINRTTILIGVFILLLGILGVVYYTSYIVPEHELQSQKKIATKFETKPSVNPTRIPTPEVDTIIQNADNNVSTLSAALTANVVGTFSDEESRTLLQNTLSELNILDISYSTGGTSDREATIVVFSSSIPLQTRESVLTSLRTIFASVSATENTASQYDIIINLGQTR